MNNGCGQILEKKILKNSQKNQNEQGLRKTITTLSLSDKKYLIK